MGPPEWWVASGVFDSTKRPKNPAEPKPNFFGDLFPAVPPPPSTDWPNEISIAQSKSQQSGAETEVVEWLTAERGQLFVIPTSCLFHAQPGYAGA